MQPELSQNFTKVIPQHQYYSHRMEEFYESETECLFFHGLATKCPICVCFFRQPHLPVQVMIFKLPCNMISLNFRSSKYRWRYLSKYPKTYSLRYIDCVESLSIPTASIKSSLTYYYNLLTKFFFGIVWKWSILQLTFLENIFVWKKSVRFPCRHHPFFAL